jgi:tRNA G37 N-methylase Trm5
LYEKEVQEYITNISNYYDIFIDLGAADGFFGIGALISKKYKKSYCFEITHEGQEAIIKNAKLNHVENDVIIEGLADQNFMDLIPNNELKKALILCDIEGGEFDLFTDEALIKLKNNLIVIEIHDFLVENGEEKLSKLLLRCSNIFDYKFLTTTSRDLSNFDALNDLTDNQRWLICSEGRPSLMKWLVLSPK